MKKKTKLKYPPTFKGLTPENGEKMTTVGVILGFAVAEVVSLTAVALIGIILF